MMKYGHWGVADGQEGAALSAVGSEGRDQHGVALVIGSEGQGLSAQSKSSCHAVSIPMPGNTESLNASHAGAILMFMLTSHWPLLARQLDAVVTRQQHS